GLPDGATLSAGTDLGNGVWEVPADSVEGLTLSPPADFSGELTLTVTATSTEGNGDSATTTASITVSVAGVADAPVLNVTDSAGVEDTAIALDIDAALTDTDGSEVLSVTVAGLPDGASLSAGTDNGDGSWTLAPADLAGLTIIPPANFAGEIVLTVAATSREVGEGTAVTTTALTVSVAAAADAPALVVADA
ncbi:Ig-like domain-containing protein, partial [Azospirillum oleiclasticum]